MRRYCFTTAGGKGDAEALVALFEGREDGLDAFFLVIAELDAGRESSRRREKSSPCSPCLIKGALVARGSPWERQETPCKSVKHGTWLCALRLSASGQFRRWARCEMAMK